MQQLKFNSPATVIEGESYMVTVAVVNQTMRRGIAYQATLETVIMASVDGVDLIPYDARTALFGAGETKTFESILNVPSGYGGMTGIIVANVFDPIGNLLAWASEDLVIIPAAVGEIPLSAGWNTVTYTGKRQQAVYAFASIAPYLVLAYYYDYYNDWWVSILDPTMLEPGMLLSINVTQDCIWTF